MEPGILNRAKCCTGATVVTGALGRVNEDHSISLAQHNPRSQRRATRQAGEAQAAPVKGHCSHSAPSILYKAILMHPTKAKQGLLERQTPSKRSCEGASTERRGKSVQTPRVTVHVTILHAIIRKSIKTR